MKVEIVYPPTDKRKRAENVVRRVFRWVFLAASVGCVTVNLCVGAPAWSAVAVWGMWSVWQCVLSPDMVERNFISQTVKALLYTCVLMALIDRLLAPGWATFVIPIAGVCGLLATAVFFLTNMRGQKQNTMPLIWLVVLSLGFFIAAKLGWMHMNWPILMLGGVAAALGCMAVVAFPGKLLRELKKRFHIE